jgi:hypothetical protein
MSPAVLPRQLVDGKWVATAQTSAPAYPEGAVARYEFADASQSVIPNRVTSAGAISALQITGTDYRVANGEILWNENIGDFSHTLQLEPSPGTYADSVTAFPNSFGSGGALGIRLRLDPSIVESLGQASLVGVVSFRPNPEINPLSTPPRSLEFRRGAPGDPLTLVAREGSLGLGYNGAFNDELESSLPIPDPSVSDLVVVFAWTPTELRLFANGVLVGTLMRATADYPTSSYTLVVALNSFVVHSDDRQFYKGAMKKLLIYDRPLLDSELDSLSSALSADTSVATSLAPKKRAHRSLTRVTHERESARTHSLRKPAPLAGKTLLRLIVPVTSVGTPSPTLCRRPPQRFTPSVSAGSEGLSPRTGPRPPLAAS